MKKRILVIAAHPDDEILGCGGAMAKHVQNGDLVHVVILAEGMTSRDQQRDREKRKEELEELVTAAKMANKIIGVTSLEFHEFPDNRMDSVDLLDIVKVVEHFVSKFKPDIVYTHHIGDVNIDHNCIHKAVVTACRPVPNQSVKQLLFFEVASSTEWQPPSSAPIFAPNWFVDISNTLDLKLKALEAYAIEMREWPHSRSITALEHLAKWRGASVGVEAAEAFIAGRILV